MHFLVISWQDYDVEFINKKSSSLEHIRERITEFLKTQDIDLKGEFYFGWTLRLRTLCYILNFKMIQCIILLIDKLN
jgi:hypothetical protein